MKFVTDGPTDQPIARSASASRSRSVATRCRLASRIVSSSRASVTSVTDTTEMEPGGRYGFIRAMSEGWAIAKPTRSPARA